MNEAKPIVTCHGNQSLFSGLHAAVVNGLPKEPCQWRRSYGRAPRSVHLSASFVPYDADILPEEEEKTLVSRPYFHIYWTDCEELAFMFEMLGLKEDALIQYDELDAMFDQFVENFASGETVRWLAPLTEPCTNWAGLSLSKPLDLDLRQQVKQNEASLLAFRNYLFSRQTALLFQMGRSWEAAMRAMDYLYNTVVEVKALEIEAPRGALACWVILSCLEVLNACNLHSPGQLDERFALYTANLWDYARKKLRELGQLCSLMPGLEPTSEQLSLVVDLVSGMGLSQDGLSPTEKLPVDKLRESLSSPNSFKKHYLSFYVFMLFRRVSKPDKAENFLLDSIRMYQQEGWQALADGTMVKLAQCQQQLDDPSKYLKTACHIACSQQVSDPERAHFFQEMLTSLDQVQDDTIEMRASQAIFVEQLHLDCLSTNLNDDINLTASLMSNFPQAMKFDSIKISISKCSEAELIEHEDRLAPTQTPTPSSQKVNTHRRQPSGTHIALDKMSNFQPITKTLPTSLEFHTFTERTKGRLVSCGTVCDRAHEILSRSDSASSTGSPTPLFKGDYSICFSQENVTLNPGQNTLIFSTKVQETGAFCLSQMCLSVQCLELLKPLATESIYFRVNSIPPEVTLKPKLSGTGFKILFP
ncbi:trafficking protein particle complex subunit 10-like [Elysia marginata]|uniref:Trafficking protein particle complex subunit 10-like n=1 Tax=Elysia marginata TaxID=1093978 RepID=A0AAV4FCX3_9GAST|nr:trafficking protein particle complex subunit 10-like [Elysia marginata]